VLRLTDDFLTSTSKLRAAELHPCEYKPRLARSRHRDRTPDTEVHVHHLLEHCQSQARSHHHLSVKEVDGNRRKLPHHGDSTGSSPPSNKQQSSPERTLRSILVARKTIGIESVKRRTSASPPPDGFFPERYQGQSAARLHHLLFYDRRRTQPAAS